MKWQDIQHMPSARFKRLAGVPKNVYLKMVNAVKQHQKRKKSRSRSGKKPVNGIEDQVLMTLMYWREYRTLFHIGASYGVSESVASRTVTKIENILSKHEQFQLPSRKKPLRQMKYEVLLVDVSESPIERPKKNSAAVIRVKRKNTR